MDPEQGYQVALKVDCDQVGESRVTVLETWMKIKRNLLGAPLTIALEALKDGTAEKLPFMEIPVRKTETTYIVAGKDPANPANWCAPPRPGSLRVRERR